MPRPRHAAQYEEMQDRIRAAAWQLMAEVGAAGLAMREVARRIGVSAPALYNYYASQDDLLTALLLEAFHGLADAMQVAHTDAQAAPVRDQFIAVAHAYRDWATAHQVRYYLIYGTPIIGYAAPRDVTVPAAVRIFALLSAILEKGLQTGALIPSAHYAQVPSPQLPILEALIQQSNYPVGPLAIYLSFKCWYTLYGLVMPVLLGHLVPLDKDAFFRDELAALCDVIGFKT